MDWRTAGFGAFLAALSLTAAASVACTRSVEAPSPQQAPVDFTAISERLDPYVPKQRIVVLTDIANEPDDQMSLVRLLVYSNEFDVEGLVATTSTWMRNKVRPDVIETLVAAYAQVRPRLLEHAAGYPEVDALKSAIVPGQTGFGMQAVGTVKTSTGAALLVRAALKPDSRPLWVLAWGGTNTLAQALLDYRSSHTADELSALVARLRVYTISDQDDAGPWIRRECPALHYIAMPSTPDGDQYASATWTGISGDLFYKNAPGADFSTFTTAWVNANIRQQGPLGKLYPFPCCIHEGDTPSFLGLIDNGLASAMSPTYGGWGGRYVWRQFYGEPRPFWTQGGDAFPGRANSRDTVIGLDGRTYTSDQASIWRWRTAFQHDFAARMAWTLTDKPGANHNPEVVVNGQPGRAPLTIDATIGKNVVLDAAGTKDPDGNALTYTWFFYPEAGTGIPTQPVVTADPAPAGGASVPGEGDIPSAPLGLREPEPRVVVTSRNTPRTEVVPKIAGTAHVILVVEDKGTPSLTSYRRVILKIRP